MSKKEQILDILNLLVIQNSYSTDEAVEDILELFNISDGEIEEASVEYSTNTETKEFCEPCCHDFQLGAKWMRDKIKGGNNEQPFTNSEIPNNYK